MVIRYDFRNDNYDGSSHNIWFVNIHYSLVLVYNTTTSNSSCSSNHCYRLSRNFYISYICYLLSKGGFPQKSLYGLLRLLNIIFSVVLTICFFIDIQGFELHLSGYLLVYSLPFCFVIPLISLVLLLKSKKKA